MKDSYVFNRERKQASDCTQERNRNFLHKYQLALLQPGSKEYEQLHWNCLLSISDPVIKDEDGTILVDRTAYGFLKSDEIPDTVNPSLWMIAQGNLTTGVYGVIGKDVIQVRGLGPGVVTLVRGKTGWILIDSLYTENVGRAAVLLAENALKEPIRHHISAVLFTLGTTDLYGNVRGGLRGILTEEELAQVPIYAPVNFAARFTKENIFTSSAGMRRQAFQFGSGLTADEKGSFTFGLGIGGPGRTRTHHYIEYFDHDGIYEIDGLKLECQLTQDVGIPGEMMIYFHEYRVLWTSEICCGTLHNIYPLRGAQIRNANQWAKQLYRAYEAYKDRLDAVMQSSNWAHINTDQYPTAAQDCLLHTAAAYKYIHDRTLNYAGKGFRAEEIAQFLSLPDAYAKEMYLRPYYGAVQTGVRAVYQQWIGGYDGNPVSLNPQTKKEKAIQFIEYAGSEERVLKLALKDFAEGNYQRVAEAADHLVFYNPKNEQARCLLADALEQLGYQAENATFRNSYLLAADELRNGVRIQIPEKDIETAEEFLTLSSEMSTESMLDYLALALDGTKTEPEDQRFVLKVEEEGDYIVHIYHGTLLSVKTEAVPEQIPVITARKGVLMALVNGNTQIIQQQIQSTDLELLEKLKHFFENPRRFLNYHIMEPLTVQEG